MSRTQKLMIGAIGVPLLIFLAPIIYTAFSVTGYYEHGRCMCGHQIFIKIEKDGYFTFSPGHERAPSRLWILRQNGAEWEALNDQGQVVTHLRFEKGQLCERFSGAIYSSRHDRVFNPWRIWIPTMISNTWSNLERMLGLEVPR